MTPASIIVDGPFCANNKCFRNFSAAMPARRRCAGGVEQSRNLMTVRAANQTGMAQGDRPLPRQMGVGDYSRTPYLPIALGAGDTTVLKRMVNAFATASTSVGVTPAP